MPPRNLLILILAFALSYACYVRGGKSPYERYVAEGLATIDANSLERVPDRELFNGAMDGMVSVLERHGDQHSRFLDAEDAESLRTEIHQEFGGIGVRIDAKGKPPRATVLDRPNVDSPAARADVRPGDRILAVDGHSTVGMPVEEVRQRVRGIPGTRVQLSLEHSDGTNRRTIDLVREVIQIESVLGDRRDDKGRWQFRLAEDPRIAQVRIVSFGEHTADELERVLTDVVKQGAEGVVLDLRGDPGGALESGIEVCNLFLPAAKLVVETRGRDHELIRRYETTEVGAFRDLPLAVLVNQDSASAAEIVAACLQDHHRAVVAGERSYGKGTVQQLIPMATGDSLLKLTWASFWRPSGKQIHRTAGSKDIDSWGVVPDTGWELPRMSKQELEAFQQYRIDRDLAGALPENEANSPQPPAEQAPFVDKQLQLAVKRLQEQLKGAKPRTLSNDGAGER
jgi:carboxyl-terminal processing protease